MSRRILVAVVAAAHVCVLAVLALSGGCAFDKKEPKLMAAGPAQEIRAPEGEPESILEPKGMEEERDLLVSREPELIPAVREEAVEPEAAAAATPVPPTPLPFVEAPPAAETPAAEEAEAPGRKAVAEAPSGATHKVAPGESLWRIARRYGLTVAELAARNNLPPDARLKAGRLLSVPAPRAAETPAAAEVTETARPAAVPEPARGPVIRQPAPRSAAQAPAPAAPRAGTAAVRRHVVRKGETLSSIARAYGVPMRRIVAANGIKDAGRIRAGQVLTIPLQ